MIKENETFVEITPVIKFSDDKVCRLEIVKSQKDIPFKVRICLQLAVGGDGLRVMSMRKIEKQSSANR